MSPRCNGAVMLVRVKQRSVFAIKLSSRRLKPKRLHKSRKAEQGEL